MTLSIITDSLSLGRIDYDKNNMENYTIFHYETWPNLLKFDNVYVNAERKRISEFLISKECQYECIDLINPDVIIVQIGVVDCAPRIFSKRENQIINNPLFPKFIRDRLIKYRSKNRAKLIKNQPLKRVYVKGDSFAFNLNQFINQNQKTKIILIPILYDAKNLDTTFTKNCVIYNNLIYDLCKTSINCFTLDVDSMTEDSTYFCKDGYHLSKKGHQEISNRLHKTIN